MVTPPYMYRIVAIYNIQSYIYIAHCSYRITTVVCLRVLDLRVEIHRTWTFRLSCRVYIEKKVFIT